MSVRVSKVVIVGGGTAGWITAALLAARHRARGVTVTLVESPDIPTIGVGEGTWPSMRMSLQKMGLPESALFADCDASLKQGTEFIGWTDERSPPYIHPFSFPSEYASLNLAGYWLRHGKGTRFADFVTPQAAVVDAGRAPKQLATPDYAFNVNYGYHFDAGRFAAALHRHAVDRLGVEYVSANVERVEAADNGDIAAVHLDTGARLDGELFVDCTGQRARLIGQHLGVDNVSLKPWLFNDAAIAVQVPYATHDAPIASVTRSTAQSAGWIWDIGLQSRRGIGYVFSTAHSDEASALETARAYVAASAPGTDLDALSFRTLRFEPGYRRTMWVNNCVAVGLSGGFVEPLEASALAMIEQAAGMISDQLPADREIMDVVARRFNDKMRYHWQRIVEFLKLHYVLNRREDSAYWRDCRDPASCPPSLRDKLTLWQQQPPWHDDAPRVDELFPSASYQYVLFGMGFAPRYDYAAGGDNDPQRASVDKLLHDNRAKSQQMVNLLPTNREFVSARAAHAATVPAA